MRKNLNQMTGADVTTYLKGLTQTFRKAVIDIGDAHTVWLTTKNIRCNDVNGNTVAFVSHVSWTKGLHDGVFEKLEGKHQLTPYAKSMMLRLIREDYAQHAAALDKTP